MSNLSHTIRKFNRFELKYLITLKQAEQFKEALWAYLSPDEHGGDHGRYNLASLYYDSPEYSCYWEKMNGVKFRRKLRIRHYESDIPLTDATPVFVEIKQRLDRVTQKRRAVLSHAAALSLCNDRQIPDHAPEDHAVMAEIQAFLWTYNLRPVSLVRYTRQALMGSEYDLGLRVTFDTGLTYQTRQLDLQAEPTPLPLFPADWVVMEIKVNERIPYWLTELVARHNLQLCRISKYCRSIELAQSVPSIPWQPVAA
jgi:SPX domain protein involved in polyphosphate accumulation